jgi:AcrR family transcriptional regulator
MREPAAEPLSLIWTRPAPPGRQRSLDRPAIVAAAMALADEAGPEALTMKAVAGRLGPYSPMALYRYVSNKDGLIDLMLDAATAEIPVPAAPGPDWRADLRELATASRRMIRRHPWYAVLVHTRPPAGPHMMRRLEFALAVLTGRGAPVADAMTYAALLDRHVLGAGLQEAEEARMDRRYGLADGARLSAAIGTMRALAEADGHCPILAGWLAEPAGADPEEQFALGLDFLLDGIAGRLPA